MLQAKKEILHYLDLKSVLYIATTKIKVEGCCMK